MLFKKEDITNEVLEKYPLIAIETDLDVNYGAKTPEKVKVIKIMKNRYNGILGIVPVYIYTSIVEEFEGESNEESQAESRSHDDDKLTSGEFTKMFEELFSSFGKFKFEDDSIRNKEEKSTFNNTFNNVFNGVLDELEPEVSSIFGSLTKSVKEVMQEARSQGTKFERDIVLKKDLLVLESIRESSIAQAVSTKKSIAKIDDKIMLIKESLGE